MNLQTNPQLEFAFEYVRNTDKSVFLTGKAGSGKTTFLHQIKADGRKRLAVVAPTGVAAINAGGMTIHSLFQLPFGIHLPGVERNEKNRQRRFSRRKTRLIRSLDLLVIDEISMVRADMLDAVDEVLRRFRDHRRPFGGVQLLMIGDLHQLPPVVKQEDWDVLSRFYDTPYFFGSRALGQTDYISIELKHVYRQSDPEFIALLNKVRVNRLDEESLRKLNSRFVADFRPLGKEISEMIQKYCAEQQLPRKPTTPPARPQPRTSETKRRSFELCRAGKSLDEIAAERHLARSTIEGHLSHFIGRGELDIYSVLDRETVVDIQQFFLATPEATAAEAKSHFGEKYSYGELNMVIRYVQYHQVP